MLKEILLLATICGANSTPLMQSTATEMEFLNSTNYQFYVDNNTQVLEPHSFGYFERWEDGDYTIYCLGNPTEQIYLWENKADNETYKPLSFNYNEYNNIYYCNIIVNDEGLNGIQLLTKKSLAGETYYIKNPDLSNLSNAYESNILPSDSTALLYLSNNTTVSINQLSFERTMQDKGITAFGQFKINGLTYIANNSTTGTTPQTYTELNPTMLYNNNYTNKLMFTSGNYPSAYTPKGYNDLNNAQLSKEYEPYVSFTLASDTSVSLVPMIVGVTLVGTTFEALNNLFGWYILPGLTLGMFLLVPVILGVMLYIIKIVKKGS